MGGGGGDKGGCWEGGSHKWKHNADVPADFKVARRTCNPALGRQRPDLREGWADRYSAWTLGP